MEEVRICDYCGMELAEDEGTYVDDELLCDDCVADHCITCNVINLKRLLNGKQNVWKHQNGEEKSDSDGREKDV